MSMNPDGTGQVALYGSGSWFPTAFRFARPVPDHPTLLAGIISGHHDYGDCGRLALLDRSAHAMSMAFAIGFQAAAYDGRNG